MINRQIVLASRPSGVPTPENFKLVENPVRELEDGEILIENQVFAIDPAIRGMLDDIQDSYLPAVPIDGLIPTMVLGRVVKSRNSAFKEGDYGRGFAGWEEYSILNPSNFAIENVHVDPTVPLTAYMGALGWSGITAYIGLKKIGEMKAGDTVVMSAAAGAVGSVGGQIARLSGCRSVGIVGSPSKAELVTGTFGLDAAINYRDTGDLAAAIKAACPDGTDLYFDNVGGTILDTMLPLMSDFGRIVVCGMVANYNDQNNPIPIHNLWQVLVHRITMKGFLAYEHLDMLEEAEAQLGSWIKSGELIALENVTTGIENTPSAFINLMSGVTTGKTVVRLNESVSTL
ncbi:MAG: NADP-dependent oxidoreductase [Sphingobium sp.]|nr:NADP-dependent oxidoreductase [Sphingobium sp.]MCP5398164.1 NADP-dependent oxidoreductase [Sphingomonas sp.]